MSVSQKSGSYNLWTRLSKLIDLLSRDLIVSCVQFLLS